MISTVQRGLSVEYRFISYCLENGIQISKPLSPDSPYDCIIELPNKKLQKIQIKRGYQSSNSSNSFICKFRSSHLNKNGSVNKSYSKEDVDGFICWYEKLPNLFFYIPNDTDKTQISICFKNKTNLKQNWYEDYIFDINMLA